MDGEIGGDDKPLPDDEDIFCSSFIIHSATDILSLSLMYKTTEDSGIVQTG